MKGVLIITVLCLFGCALFNKTSKTTTTDTQSSTKQLESSQLLLKKADKETQIFTYWNDSGFYQFQYIKEQVDQAKSGKFRADEKQSAKNTMNSKTVEPVGAWIYVMILIGLAGVYLVFRRFTF